ncbi:hypothetical protein FGK63_18170 [Ruegeria sediminis]|uniref:DUF4265 domain-containing protein n=1 Tax=Ruegeria sediminis TaxID=2583820 RepID=A0ABY2WTR4_9RHOB|nr:hypothetical protein [Ruegeria sediminis]TMV04214.1 hypothetical protein FGK63_18170 [Ruegeria sediminis]
MEEAMTENSWIDILNRISEERPAHLDDLVLSDVASPPLGKVLMPQMDLPCSRALWEGEVGAPTYIGIRILEAPETPTKVARRLAAAAIERGVVPVILSRIDLSGFEQFGFRVERIPEDHEAAQNAEEEIGKFWNLAIIIDGTEVGLLK